MREGGRPGERGRRERDRKGGRAGERGRDAGREREAGER